MNEDAKFHWSEGMKFASEGIKSLFILNGAAAISILTFLGNSRTTSTEMIWAMIWFALGTASGTLSFALAYLAQLGYGNVDYKLSGKFHNGTYVSIAFGIGAFLIGMILAALGLFSTLISKPYHYN